ncbi:hypothetical protein C8R44DRAFT_739489 [Mycena epipterygia]|nr:hypothetical protein C8R44DRAFT_739489 [Mycena epipterygia]
MIRGEEYKSRETTLQIQGIPIAPSANTGDGTGKSRGLRCPVNVHEVNNRLGGGGTSLDRSYERGFDMARQTLGALKNAIGVCSSCQWEKAPNKKATEDSTASLRPGQSECSDSKFLFTCTTLRAPLHIAKHICSEKYRRLEGLWRILYLTIFMGGPSCTTCLTTQGSSDVLYAMANPAFNQFRVGFMSAGQPTTLSEAENFGAGWQMGVLSREIEECTGVQYSRIWMLQELRSLWWNVEFQIHAVDTGEKDQRAIIEFGRGEYGSSDGMREGGKREARGRQEGSNLKRPWGPCAGILT